MSGPGTDSIGSKVARGARWMVVLRLAERLVGLASFAVLARVLLPADFGLMALATSAIAFIELFGQAGIDLALIKRRDAGREEYDTAWTINVLLGVAIAIVVAGAARPLAGLVHEARIEDILYWLAAASVLHGFQNVGIVDFQKFFAFHKEFRFRLATRMLRVVTTIAFALAWRNYWALVAGYLAGTAILVLLSYVLHPYRPRFSLRAMRSFTHFSGWVLVRNIVGGANDHLVNFIVARQSSVTGLAFLSAGREFAELATTEIQAPIRRALFPGFAAMSDEPDALRRSYLEWTAIMALFTFPIPAGVAMVAPDAVLVLMGDQWLAAVPLIRILTCAGIFRASASGAQSLFIAIGKPRLAATLAVVRAVLLIPLVVIGTFWADAAGAAWAILATSGVMCAVNIFLVASVLQLRTGSLLHVTYRPIVATVLMVAVVWGIYSVLPPRDDFMSALLSLIAVMLAGAAVYAVSLLTLWSLAGRPHDAEWRALKFLKMSIAPQIAG